MIKIAINIIVMTIQSLPQFIEVLRTFINGMKRCVMGKSTASLLMNEHSKWVRVPEVQKIKQDLKINFGYFI